MFRGSQHKKYSFISKTEPILSHPSYLSKDDSSEEENPETLNIIPSSSLQIIPIATPRKEYSTADLKVRADSDEVTGEGEVEPTLAIQYHSQRKKSVEDFQDEDPKLRKKAVVEITVMPPLFTPLLQNISKTLDVPDQNPVPDELSLIHI